MTLMQTLRYAWALKAMAMATGASCLVLDCVVYQTHHLLLLCGSAIVCNFR